MNTTLAADEFDGLKLPDALCVSETNDLAMEVAEWLYWHFSSRRSIFPQRLLRIIDATDHPAIRGYLIFWPMISDRICWPQRAFHRQAIATQFGGRGLRWLRLPRPGAAPSGEPLPVQP